MFHEIYDIDNIIEAINEAQDFLEIEFDQSEINSLLTHKEAQIFDEDGDDLAWVWYDQDNHLIVIEM